MTLDDLTTLLKTRRSIRAFSDESVDTATIAMLLKSACLSPSVENTQPWRFHVIVNPTLKIKLSQASCYGNFVPGAAAFLVVTCDKTAQPSKKDIVWNPRELEYSCVSAIENLLLAATAHGLGTCWVSLHHGEAHEILNLPERELVIGGIMIGKPRGEEKPQEKERKDPADIMIVHD